MNDTISRTASSGEAFYLSHNGHKFGPYTIPSCERWPRPDTQGALRGASHHRR